MTESPRMIADMTGEAAIVTGAASGLGRATAAMLARAGAGVLLVDVNPDGLAETAALLADSGVAVHVHPADLADEAACRAVVPAAIERFGRLDALCNVAGLIYLANTPEMPFAQWQRTIAVNLTAPFLLSQAAIPHLIETNGAIVNIASSASFIGEAYAAAYCASKGAILQMTKSMALEYTHKSVRINAVAPGGMITNIAVNFRLPDGGDIDLVRRYTPLRGVVEVDDVAAMVGYLASDAGRGFHGACIVVDAGLTAG